MLLLLNQSMFFTLTNAAVCVKLPLTCIHSVKPMNTDRLSACDKHEKETVLGRAWPTWARGRREKRDYSTAESALVKLFLSPVEMCLLVDLPVHVGPTGSHENQRNGQEFTF